MSGNHEYRLRIDVFSVESLPMSRLAEYMAELARLLGEQERVHFSRLETGSAVLVSRIEEPAAPKVEERLQKVRDGSAPKDAMQAYKTLDTLLAKDNAVELLPPKVEPRLSSSQVARGPSPCATARSAKMVHLMGWSSALADGMNHPVLLVDAEGAVYPCQTTVELSKQLAPYYRGATLRVYGSGKWVREENGSWVLQQFDISSFDVLDDSPLVDVVAKLRAVEGSEWGKDASLGDVLGFRREEGTSH